MARRRISRKISSYAWKDIRDTFHRLLSLDLKGILRVMVVCAIVLLILAQVVSRNDRAIASPISEKLWGITQVCTFEIRKPSKSLDGSTQGFDGKTAYCQRGVDYKEVSWIFTRFEDSKLQIIQSVQLEVKFYLSEIKPEDTLLLQVSTNNGMEWITVEEFNASNPAPTELELKN